jgi:hypothetical protein
LAYGRGIALESRICSIAHLASEIRLIDAPLAAHSHQLVGETPLLLSIEARIDRLGGIGERLLIDGARGLKIGFLAHVFDDIDGLLLRPSSVRAAISRSACFLLRSCT